MDLSGSIRPQQQLTEDDRRVWKECDSMVNRRTLALTAGVAAGLLWRYQRDYYATTGIKRALLHLSGGAFASYIVAAATYYPTCREKFRNLENSVVKYKLFPELQRELNGNPNSMAPYSSTPMNAAPSANISSSVLTEYEQRLMRECIDESLRRRVIPMDLALSTFIIWRFVRGKYANRFPLMMGHMLGVTLISVVVGTMSYSQHCAEKLRNYRAMQVSQGTAQQSQAQMPTAASQSPSIPPSSGQSDLWRPSTDTSPPPFPSFDPFPSSSPPPFESADNLPPLPPMATDPSGNTDKRFQTYDELRDWNRRNAQKPQQGSPNRPVTSNNEPPFAPAPTDDPFNSSRRK